MGCKAQVRAASYAGSSSELFIMSPLFSPAERARVQCCEDEPTDVAHRVTTWQAVSRTSCRHEAEGERGSLRSICVPDEDQSAQATIRGGRGVPTPLGLRKR